jgi:Na+/melibiose symporter-like transporter
MTSATRSATEKPPAPALDYDSTGQRIWRVGSLTYNRGQLSNVFLWMLWGDFCLHLMDMGVVPNVVPLQMNKYGASGFMIGLITGTVMEVMSTVLVAVVGTWSDRHRGRLGRRMPFLLWATPPLAVCLALLGFSPQLAGWLKAHAPALLGGVSIASVTIGTMALALTAYKFFDIVPQSVYYYLWPDVIPAKLMGTFTCWFKVVGTLGVMFFNWRLLKYATSHPEWICLLAAGLYLFAFLILVFMVREGEYPPPEPPPEGTASERLAKTVVRYAIECFSRAYYWKIYLFNLFFIAGLSPLSYFLVIYGTKTLGIDEGRYGSAMAVRDGVRLVVFLAMGPLVDRFHPIRAGIVANILACLTAAAAFIFTRGQTSFMVMAVAVFIAIAIFQASTFALGPRILPQKQYGQFCSAIGIVYRLGVAVAMPLAGLFFDRFGYHYLFAWFAVFTLLSSVMIISLYFDWKRLGGDEHYVAPVVEEEQTPDRRFEVVTNDR